jgi:hypothetical protein
MQRPFLLVALASVAAAACSASNPATPVPGTPASQRVTGGPIRPAGTHGRTTFAIGDEGGTFTFPPYATFSGTGSYTANDAPSGAMLQITNSGAINVLGVPISAAGTAVLFVEAQVSEASYVTFRNVNKTMTLKSTKFTNGASFSIAVYLWNQLIESYSAGTATADKLTFQTPFSGLTMYYYTPIAIEVVKSSGASPSPSPTPSASPTPYPQTLYAAYHDPTYGGLYSFDGDDFGSAPTNFNPISDAYALGVDDSQNVYVTSSNPAMLGEYYPGGSLEYTYSNDVQSPTSVAVDAGSNPNIDVANGSGTSGADQLLGFAQGVNQASPYHDPNLLSIQGVTLDAVGNAYIGGTSVQNTPQVDLMAASGGFTNLGLQLTSTPNALTLDQNGNLLVTQSTGVAVFEPGDTSPSSVLGSQQPAALAFGNGGNWLYVAYNSYGCYRSCVNVYAYPAGTLLGQYSLSGTSGYFGVAIAPRVPLFNPNHARRKHVHFRDWTDFRGRVRHAP